MLYTVLISLTWLVSLPCPIKAVTYSVSEAPRLACKMPVDNLSHCHLPQQLSPRTRSSKKHPQQTRPR
eukprot:scaffold3547_cov20-Tisochrysis_lutea.AAC.2